MPLPKTKNLMTLEINLNAFSTSIWITKCALDKMLWMSSSRLPSVMTPNLWSRKKIITNVSKFLWDILTHLFIPMSPNYVQGIILGNNHCLIFIVLSGYYYLMSIFLDQLVYQ